MNREIIEQLDGIELAGQVADDDLTEEDAERLAEQIDDAITAAFPAGEEAAAIEDA